MTAYLTRLLLAADRARPDRDERGASAVEYGLLIAGIAALISLVVYAFGGGVGSLFSDTCDSIQASRGATCSKSLGSPPRASATRSSVVG
jgi:pilus assembly protein Flp/PilA